MIGSCLVASSNAPRFLHHHVYFCIGGFEFVVDGLAEDEVELFVSVEEWLVDPVVPSDPSAFMASKTDMPCGPMVIRTGSPSGDIP